MGQAMRELSLSNFNRCGFLNPVQHCSNWLCFFVILDWCYTCAICVASPDVSHTKSISSTNARKYQHRSALFESHVFLAQAFFRTHFLLLLLWFCDEGCLSRANLVVIWLMLKAQAQRQQQGPRKGNIGAQSGSRSCLRRSA